MDSNNLLLSIWKTDYWVPLDSPTLWCPSCPSGSVWCRPWTRSIKKFLLIVLVSFGISGKLHDCAFVLFFWWGQILHSHWVHSFWSAAGLCSRTIALSDTLLYIWHAVDIATVLASCGILSQPYGDNIKTYLQCPAPDVLSAVATMQRAMVSLGAWMSSNRLRLTAPKTPFLWQGNSQQNSEFKKMDSLSITLTSFTLSSPHLRIVLGSHLSFPFSTT